MRTFLLRRLLSIVPLVFAITFLTQTLLVLSPGNYLDTLRDNPSVSQATIDILKERYHLDSDNPFERYYYWVKNAVKLDFGRSFRFQQDCWDLMQERFYNTLLLAIAALIISWGLAIPLGVLSAVKKDSIFDRGSGMIAYLGLSMPSVFYSLLMLLFAAKTGWFPIGGNRDQINWDYMSTGDRILDTLWHLVLPATVLGTIQTAQFMRQMRGEMIETLSQDYIRTARAKGLSPGLVLFRHALGNAINPLITLFGFALAFLLAGALITEIVFSWPGMGRLTFDALSNKDEPLVMASIVLLTVMLVLGNLVADLLLAWVDPRIKLE
jgi:peptide/nickel transport system permease protein